MTLLLSLLTAACADTGEVEVETAEFGESTAALSCPPRGALCVTAAPTRWVDVSVDRAPSGETRTEVAQILQVTAEGYPARVTLATDRGFSTDTAARLIADLRIVSSGSIPSDALAATAVASGSIPVPSIPAGVGSVTVPLLPLGAPRKLAAGTAYALTLRIEPGQTGLTTLKVGAVDDGSGVNGKVSTRTRPLSNGILQPASFAELTPAADLVLALQTEASSSNSCVDGAQGPLETDVDCGGTCSPCSTTKKCVSNADCASNSCVTGKCAVPNCNNSKFEQNETDIDCGGVCATKCGQAKRCKIDGDCVSTLRCIGSTATTFGSCRPAICGNGVKDQTETGVDCNSTNTPCALCGVGAACAANGQCGTGRCDLAAKKCIAATCSDKIADGGETDIDCGAVCGVGCAATKKCILNADCITGSCVAGKCAPSPCLDKKLSPGESDVDCGGVCVTGNRVGAPIVLKCAANKLCGSNDDCTTGLVCFNDGTAGRCVAATCGNGVKDLTETDIDCGGKCRPCVNTKVCKLATDCLSKSCEKAKTTDATGVCKTTCSDKAINGGESDVDCGQSCASGPGAEGLCVAGKKCGTDLDCASGICDPAKRTCVDVCRNNTRDVTEGDVDCGGECKLKCMESQACRIPADCNTGACSNGVCVAATCSDGAKNGSETGVDCGGSCANDCIAGGSCLASTDCASGLACKANICVTSTCTDLIQGGTEGDVDCGGSCTTKCAVTKKCAVKADCASATCIAGICRAVTCTNGTKDVAEGDVDCGATCSPCAVGKGCTVDAGCSTRNCNLTAKTCAAPSTTNTKADGDETDVNCGGSAPQCADTKKCMIGADCVSGSCVTGKCAKAACTDGVKNGTETGVDCGGTCGACPSGRPCTADTQCASNQCVSGVCTGYACTDGLRNGNESDVDCGGSCGRFDTNMRCDAGQKCASNTDCGFGTVCKGYVCVCPAGVTCGRVDDDAACAGVTCNTPPGPCFESAGTCRAGRCDYKPKSRFASCSDMDPCSSGDVCDGSGQCVGAPIAGCMAACTISTVVYAVGTRNPSNVCQVCDPEANPTGWTNVATGVSCDDGNVCTASDSCSAAGTCVGTTTAGNQCGSGLVCAATGCASGCWISGQLVAPGATPSGNPCQKCDPVANAYGWTFVAANSTCDDGLAATTGDACDGGGRCVGTSSKKSNGLACAAATDCASGFCADGVCCNSDCNAGTCDACSVREGAAVDGVCAPVVANTKVCRPAAGECDAAEYCDGRAVVCPGDGKTSSGTLCSGGVCRGDGTCGPPPGSSCYTIKMQNPSATDGLYTIDPDGAGPIAPAQLFCDMTNGGWTLVANVYDSAGDDAPNATDYVVSGWQQTASGQWNRSVSKVERNASGTGSSAVSLAFVAALKASANQQHLKMCFVHQNGTDTTCRSSHDGSMTLVSYPTGNPKLTVYSGNTLPYTYGRLAGLAGSVDGYDTSMLTNAAFCIPRSPGDRYEFGATSDNDVSFGICDCGLGIVEESRGVWHGWGNGMSYTPNRTDHAELHSGTAFVPGAMQQNPLPSTFGIRLYVGPPDSMLSGSSCHAIKTQNPSATDGLYMIDPDGTGPIAPAQLFCDMTNGGWTLVANIYDSAGDDAPNATDYVVSGWQEVVIQQSSVMSSGYLVGPELDFLSDFTMAAWVRLNDGNSSGAVIGRYPSYELNVNDLTKKVVVHTRESSVSGGTLVSPEPLSAGEWHHLAFSLSGSIGRLFIDGIEVASMATMLTAANTADKVHVGRSPWGGNLFQGSIARVALWDRALSPPEILNVSADEMHPQSDLSLRAYWPLNGNGVDLISSTRAVYNGVAFSPSLIKSWTRQARTVQRSTAEAGSGAVSLAFVAALKGSANQQHLKMCFVHQNGADTTCRSSSDGSMTLVSYATGNPKLTVYAGNTLPYTYGRLAGLAGSVDSYESNSFAGSVSTPGYPIPRSSGAAMDFGDNAQQGLGERPSSIDDFAGVWHGWGCGMSWMPSLTTDSELRGRTADRCGTGPAVPNPSLTTYGFRLYIGPSACGNGVLDPGEQCDPGPLSRVGCSSSCQLDFVSTRVDGQVQFVESFDGNQMSHMNLCQGCAGIGCPSFSGGRMTGVGDWNVACVPSSLVGDKAFQFTFDWYPDTRMVTHAAGFETGLDGGQLMKIYKSSDGSLKCLRNGGAGSDGSHWDDLARPLSMSGSYARVQIGYLPGQGAYIADQSGVLCRASMTISSRKPRLVLGQFGVITGQQQIDNVTYSTW